MGNVRILGAGGVTSINGVTGAIQIGGVNLLPDSAREKTGAKEFVAYADLDPLFGKYGVGVYTISFDIKTGKEGDVSLYCHPGPETNFTYKWRPLDIKIHATTAFMRHSATVDVSVSNPDATGSTAGKTPLCFYGTYDTGVIPTVKNVKVERGNVATPWTPAPEDYLGPANIWNITQMRRNIFRGQNLGSTLTDAQKAAIAAGTFDDMYVGDYWSINSHTWRIADFDYWLGKGDTSCTKHHIVVVPDGPLYSAQMHNTDTGNYVAGADNNSTAGGYALSDMRQLNLARAKTLIETDFGVGSILNHRILVTNVVANGYPSGGIWDDSEVDLMNECMVYGMPHFKPAATGSIVPHNYTTEYTQLALFQLAPYYIQPNRSLYWLRDVVSASAFADVYRHGYAHCYDSSKVCGVRPAVGIVGA